MFKIMTVAGVVVLLFGCASVDKPAANISCSGQNWKTLGMQTAQELKPVRTFDTYLEQCGSNLDPNAKAEFVDGYARALIDICNYDKGFQLGAENRVIPDVCPLEVRADFQRGYVQGKRDYDQKMRNLKRLADQKEEIEKRRGPLQGSSSLSDSGWGTGVNEK